MIESTRQSSESWRDWPLADKRALLERLQSKPSPIWIPQPGPQTLAYNSQADVIGYGGAAGGGKALALYTPLPTPTGWTTMGDVQPGDYLLDDAGRPCLVTAVSEIMIGREVYEVKFDDGSTIAADIEHQWRTDTRAERETMHKRTPAYREARRASRPSRAVGKRPDLALLNQEREYALLDPPVGEIRTTRQIAYTLTAAHGAKNHAIRVCAPLQLPQIDLPIHPYVLGAWLGDGRSNGQGFACADNEIVERIKASGYAVNKWSGNYAYGILGLTAPLREMGLLDNKHIPDEYLRASEAQRLDLLRGLMDTDGTALPTGSCELYTTNWNLANGTWKLLQTLGIKCSIRAGVAMLNGKDCGPKYRIKFTTSRQVFYLTRKAVRQITKERGTQACRYIVDVCQIPSVPVKCVSVDSPSHLYLAGETMIPTHNSDLLMGMAATKHQRSIILRRVFPSLRGMIDRSREIYNRAGESNLRDSFNEQLHVWRMADGRMVEFGAVQYEKDKHKHQGQPRDFIGFDEVTEFSETIVRFLMAWNRTTTPGQRCRVMMTFNPPMDESQDWVVRFFAPWLDPLHPAPAADGELRWYAMIDGTEQEMDGPQAIEHDGETIMPRSRTFYHAYLKDNPILESTGYGAQIDALPEPLRSLLKGMFNVERLENPFQVIPAAWVRAAMERWKVTPRPAIPQTALGVDVAYGGRDKFVIAPLYGYWLDALIKLDGAQVPDGVTGANHVFAAHRNDAKVKIDFIGWGTAAYEHLRDMVQTVPVNFGEGTSFTDKSGRMRFANVRAAAYWHLRELLDPENNSSICLPDDRELHADLCAPKWELRGGRIYLDSKEDIRDRLGRSPDCGDAAVLAFWGEGPVAAGVIANANPQVTSRFVRGPVEESRWKRKG